MSQEQFEVPEDIDDVLDDSVSALYGTDIEEVELPDFDPEGFEGDDDAND